MNSEFRFFFRKRHFSMTSQHFHAMSFFWPRCRTLLLPAAAYTIETSRLYIVRYDAIVLLQRWQFSRVG